MIDASHNIKDPLEDLLQSVDAMAIAYTQSLLVDRAALFEAQHENDVVRCQQILQDAFRTDVRPLVAEARRMNGASLDPITQFRSTHLRKKLIKARGSSTRATGL